MKRINRDVCTNQEQEKLILTHVGDKFYLPQTGSCHFGETENIQCNVVVKQSF